MRYDTIYLVNVDNVLGYTIRVFWNTTTTTTTTTDVLQFNGDFEYEIMHCINIYFSTLVVFKQVEDNTIQWLKIMV